MSAAKRFVVIVDGASSAGMIHYGIQHKWFTHQEGFTHIAFVCASLEWEGPGFLKLAELEAPPPTPPATVPATMPRALWVPSQTVLSVFQMSEGEKMPVGFMPVGAGAVGALPP